MPKLLNAHSVPFALRQTVETELDRLERQGIWVGDILGAGQEA